MLNFVAVRRSPIAKKFTDAGVKPRVEARQGLVNEASAATGDIPGVYGAPFGIYIAIYGADVQIGLALLGGVFLAFVLWRIHLAYAWWMTRRLGRRLNSAALWQQPQRCHSGRQDLCVKASALALPLTPYVGV
jgi:hypothetical protein